MFSIDDAYEKIYNLKTREYFKEVLITFNSECYRSSVVMLYSVTLCDLIFKLHELVDLYENNEAQNIISLIEEKQKQNSKSPEWENELLIEIKRRTQLLDEAEYTKILYLQQIRHLCSHPVMKKDEKILYVPNRDEVKALIRNILEGVLLKPSIMLNQIFDQLIVDIAKYKDSLEDNDLSKYLKCKYFDKMLPKVQIKIFKILWKLVFKVTDENCEINRKANYLTLRLVFDLQKDKIIDMISDEKQYFSNIEPDKPAILLINFLSEYDTNKKIYNLLESNAHAIIDSLISNNYYLEVRGWFIHDNLQQHFLELTNNDLTWKMIANTTKGFNNSIKKIYNLSINLLCENEFYMMAINMFYKSDCYDMANYFFESIIKPHLKKFNKEHFELLIKIINSNSQIYDRTLAKQTNAIIKKHSDNYLSQDYYNDFKNFKYINTVQDDIDFDLGW